MAAGNTYTPIATTTVSSNQSSYTFSSIPGSYTHLELIVNGQVNNANYTMSIAFNGNTGSYNHGAVYMGCFGATFAGYKNDGQLTSSMMYNGFSTQTAGSMARYFFPFYTSTAVTKSYIAKVTSTDGYETTIGVGTVNAATAITSIKISPDGNNTRASFTAGTTMTLYGILEA